MTSQRKPVLVQGVVGADDDTAGANCADDAVGDSGDTDDCADDADGADGAVTNNISSQRSCKCLLGHCNCSGMGSASHL